MIFSHLSVLQGTWPRFERGFLCVSHEGLPNTVLMWHASWSWFLSFFCPASRTLLVKCCELLVTFGNGVGAGKVVLMSKLFIRFLTISFTVRKLYFCFWFCGGRCCKIFCFCRGWWALRKRITWCRYQHDLRFASNLSLLPHWWCAWLRLHQCHPFLRVSTGGNGCHKSPFCKWGIPPFYDANAFSPFGHQSFLLVLLMFKLRARWPHWVKLWQLNLSWVRVVLFLFASYLQLLVLLLLPLPHYRMACMRRRMNHPVHLRYRHIVAFFSFCSQPQTCERLSYLSPQFGGTCRSFAGQSCDCTTSLLLEVILSGTISDIPEWSRSFSAAARHPFLCPLDMVVTRMDTPKSGIRAETGTE